MASASISSPCGTERLSFEARLSASTSSSSSERSLSPERERATRELERRSFLRAYSRKSLESNPEDEELVVGDDGMISVVPLDEHAQLERMRQLLDKKERETRLAAEYGLSLLESNEELHLEIEALKIQHEAETAELEADRDLYRRRHELALQEVESWRSEAKRHEEAKYQLSAELEKLAGRCECVRDGRSAVQRQHQRIQELEATVAELQASETSNATVILALKKWKSMVESERKKKADLAEDESASERLYVQKLEQDTARLRFQLVVAQGEKKRLDGLVDDAEQALKAARNEIDELHGQLKATESELHAQAELLLTAESKCGRLERERAIMEQVANLPVAVFDQDDDDDDDDDDYDYDDDANNKTMSDDETKTEIEDPMSEEEWFSQKRSASVSVFHCGPRTPANAPPGHNARVPATPSSMATHQKLHHYFHLTALSIIHENNLHERCFDSSSRATIDTWYQEVVDQGVQFLEWHAWLINRIGAVAAAMQREEEALERSAASQSMNGKSPTKSHSPFRAFMRRRESSKAQESFQGSTLPTQHPYGLTPSQVPATPRVPSSVAWSFFSRLVGRRDNQDHHTDD